MEAYFWESKSSHDNILPAFVYHLVQIRDFEYSPEAQENRKQELEKLVQDQEGLRSSLLLWCYTSYGEVFSFIVSLMICLKLFIYQISQLVLL